MNRRADIVLMSSARDFEDVKKRETFEIHRAFPQLNAINQSDRGWGWGEMMTDREAQRRELGRVCGEVYAQ